MRLTEKCLVKVKSFKVSQSSNCCKQKFNHFFANVMQASVCCFICMLSIELNFAKAMAQNIILTTHFKNLHSVIISHILLRILWIMNEMLRWVNNKQIRPEQTRSHFYSVISFQTQMKINQSYCSRHNLRCHLLSNESNGANDGTDLNMLAYLHIKGWGK